MELSYQRAGTFHIGRLRTSPIKANWATYRIGQPLLYPNGRRWVGWSFSLTTNHRLSDFAALAQVIEASGASWSGFQKQSGGKLFDKETLLPPVPAAA